MEPKNQERLDARLDRALEEYGMAEPRPGLENRVLANLASEKEQAARRRWWWVLGTAGAAATVALAVWVGSGARNHAVSNDVALTRPEPIHQERSATKPVENQAAARNPVARTPKHTASGPQPEHAVVAVAPKLDTFPSPLPLSEQEQLLVRYVSDFRNDAVRVARAQAALLKRELLPEDSETEKQR